MPSGDPNATLGDGPNTPRRIGSFDIIELVGRGGMGCVYRARDLRLGREVALKCPRPDLLESPRFRRRFLREARTASHLLHPNITTVFEAFESDGVPWLAMEYVDGGSLRSRMGHAPMKSVEEIVAHAEGLASALVAAHAAHILHRDINPNNILIGSDGRARLTDFGLARAVLESSVDAEASTLTHSTAITGKNKVMGTRGYMSPEQALGRELDSRSDIFSLGLVLYEMCTGHAAFPADDDSWIDALLHREPDPVYQYNYEVPAELERVIRKATAKRPDERYQAASDLLADLKTLRRSLESGARDLGIQERPVPRKRKWMAFVAATVVGLSLATIVTWLMLGDKESDLPFHNWASRQLTSAPGWEAEPALSPDGSLIAFSSNESGNADLWLMDVVGGSKIQLTNDPAADRHPAWFPNGGWLAFESDHGGQISIWKVASLGGSPIRLIDNAEDPAISPKGKLIAFSRKNPSGMLRIHVAPVDDPQNSRVLTGDDDGLWDHTDPAWAPDGTKLCYADARDLWVVSVDGGGSVRLTTAHASDGEPDWFENGRRIVFSSMREGAFALWQVAAEGGSPQRVTFGTGPEREPSVAKRARRIAYSTMARVRDVILLDMETGRRTRLPSVRIENTPIISPAGDAVAFVSNRMGNFDLWIQRLDGIVPVGPPRRLTDHLGSVATPRFSVDGTRIAYHRVEGAQRDIWTLKLPSGRPQRFTDHAAMDTNPAFSPDGSKLAFISNRNGIEHVWIGEFADGEQIGDPIMVTDGDQTDLFPDWSPDGSHLAFIRDGEVWIVGIQPALTARQLTEGAQASIVRWENGGETLLVSGSFGTQEMHLRRVSFLDGVGVPVSPPVVFGETTARGLFGASRDSKVIGYVDTANTGDLWLMEEATDD